jgi:hypothetical protein
MRSPLNTLASEEDGYCVDKQPADTTLEPVAMIEVQDGEEKNFKEQIQSFEQIKTLFSPILVEKNPRQDTKKAVYTGDHFQMEDDSIIQSPRLKQEDDPI